MPKSPPETVSPESKAGEAQPDAPTGRSPGEADGETQPDAPNGRSPGEVGGEAPSDAPAESSPGEVGGEAPPDAPTGRSPGEVGGGNGEGFRILVAATADDGTVHHLRMNPQWITDAVEVAIRPLRDQMDGFKSQVDGLEKRMPELVKAEVKNAIKSEVPDAVRSGIRDGVKDGVDGVRAGAKAARKSEVKAARKSRIRAGVRTAVKPLLVLVRRFRKPVDEKTRRTAAPGNELRRQFGEAEVLWILVGVYGTLALAANAATAVRIIRLLQN